VYGFEKIAIALKPLLGFVCLTTMSDRHNKHLYYLIIDRVDNPTHKYMVLNKERSQSVSRTFIQQIETWRGTDIVTGASIAPLLVYLIYLKNAVIAW
jgi:hypothetical protein